MSAPLTEASATRATRARHVHTIAGWVSAAFVAGLLVMASAPSTAEAQTATDARLVVTSLTGIAGPGSPAATTDDVTIRLLVENEGRTATDDLSVLVEVFEAAGSRSALHDAVDAGEPRALVEDLRVEVPSRLQPGDIAAVTIVVAGDATGWSETGVHPLRISLLEGRTLLDEVDTAVVYLAGAPVERLTTVFGWPLDAPPRAPDAATDAESRLVGLVRALASSPLDAQLLVGPHVLEDLADVADTTLADAIRQLATTGVGVVPGIYADADLAGLVANGLLTEAFQQLTAGQRQVERQLDVAGRRDTVWAGAAPMSPAAVSQVLVPAGIRYVVLPWTALAEGNDARLSATPPPLRSLRAGGRELIAAVGDPWLTELLADLDDAHGIAVAVQRIVAETAMLHLERPNAAGRGVILLPPPAWDPDARVARALAEVVPRLPWLEVTDIPTLAAAVPQRPIALLDEPDRRVVDAQLAERIRLVRSRVSSLQAALPDGSGDVGGRAWDDLDESLLRASSSWPLRRHLLLDAVERALSVGYGQVSLPNRAVVTLTDPQGTVPVTVGRADGGPIRVAVTLDAPPRLRLTDGNRQVVELSEGSTTTIAFPVEARGTGRIPVTVRVTDPSGTVELERSTLIVRSTALSAPALTVLGAILALLVLWWLVRRIRPPRPQLHVVRDEAA